MLNKKSCFIGIMRLCLPLREISMSTEPNHPLVPGLDPRLVGAALEAMLLTATFGPGAPVPDAGQAAPGKP
jgi:hypothetical protein